MTIKRYKKDTLEISFLPNTFLYVVVDDTGNMTYCSFQPGLHSDNTGYRYIRGEFTNMDELQISYARDAGLGAGDSFEVIGKRE